MRFERTGVEACLQNWELSTIAATGASQAMLRSLRRSLPPTSIREPPPEEMRPEPLSIPMG
jgi:hypothetical protein